jgi:hypothetical protein
MSLGGRDEVTFVCTKRMAEKAVVIATCTTLHNGNQSCLFHNNFCHNLLTGTTGHGQYQFLKLEPQDNLLRKLTKKRAITDMRII